MIAAGSRRGRFRPKSGGIGCLLDTDRIALSRRLRLRAGRRSVAIIDSAALTPEQLDNLLRGIAPARDYTFRLVKRMAALNFLESDALKLASLRASDAVEHLYQVAAELERVAKLPKWAGGQMPQEPKPRSRRARRN